MKLALLYEACVRTRSRHSHCDACRAACPVDAIALDGPGETITVALDRCVGCGLCVAACPTDAFTAPFELARLVAHSDGMLGCDSDGLPCIGALAAEDLVTLATRVGRVCLVDGPCRFRDAGHGRALERVGEAQRLLDALGVRATVEWQADPGLPPPPAVKRPVAAQRPPRPAPVSEERRSFLRMFVPRPRSDRPRLVQPGRLDPQRLVEVPARRQRLLATLPSMLEPTTATLPQRAVPFVANHRLAEARCNGCRACIESCPTGALFEPAAPSELHFDVSRCVACGLCHEVCEPTALTVAPDVSIVDFASKARRPLGKLPRA